MSYIDKLDDVTYRINKGFVPNMRVRKLKLKINGLQVPGLFFVNDALKELVFEELEAHCNAKGVGGFLPAVSLQLTQQKLMKSGNTNWKCSISSRNRWFFTRDARYS